MDLTGLSDANAYNWNGFTAGLQVPMSLEGGRNVKMSRERKNNGLNLRILLVVEKTQMLNETGLFTYILAFFWGGKCR